MEMFIFVLSVSLYINEKWTHSNKSLHPRMDMNRYTPMLYFVLAYNIDTIHINKKYLWNTIRTVYRGISNCHSVTAFACRFNVSIRTARPLFTADLFLSMIESNATSDLFLKLALSQSSFSLLPGILSRFSATYRQFSACFSDTRSRWRDCYRFCVENLRRGRKNESARGWRILKGVKKTQRACER